MLKKIDKKNTNKIGLVLIVLIVLILVLILVISNLVDNEPKNVNIPTEFDDAIELLKYYKCENISINNSTEDEFEKDIYLTFGRDLWTENKSNEGYFNNIIVNLTPILYFKSYRMIDSTRELVIAIVADEEEIKAVYINGETNYFQKEETKKVAKMEFKEFKSINMEINSKEIQELINNNWYVSKVQLGTVESRFNNYDIYFDEGIEVKTLGGRVYNIVFNKKYKSNIVSNIKVNESREKIINTLGEPTFENRTFNIIGYKGKNIYIFFLPDEVSIYRIENDYKEDAFLKLLSEFQENKNAKEFVSRIIELWNDFDKYVTDSQFVYIKYTLRGIVIQFNINGENGLVIYNNFAGILDKEKQLKVSDINEDNIPDNIYLHTTEDLIFTAEIERASENEYIMSDEIMNMQDEELRYKNTDDIEEKYLFSVTETNSFRIIYSYTNDEGIYGVKIVSRDGKNPNSELIRHKQIYTYGWITQNQFLYSVKEKGIYCYNAITRELSTVIEGGGDFKIKEFKNGKIYYDDTSIDL